MEAELIKMVATAAVVSVAAVCAPVVNKLRNFPAAGCALAGGVLPWLTFATLFRWPTLNWLALLSLVFMASSFLFALFFYAVEEPAKRRTTALAAIAVASCAAIYFGVLIGYPLLLAGI